VFPIATPVTVIVVVTIAALILTIISILCLGSSATGSTYPKNKSERHETPANHFSQIIHGMSPLFERDSNRHADLSRQIDRFGSPRNSQIF
jgi:hypothetical protein